MQATLTLAEGHTALANLITSTSLLSEDHRNEAQTRFDIIDRLLVECLGWSRELKSTKINVEVHGGGEYTDYELGNPRCAVWEAKREGSTFLLPPGTVRKSIQDIKSIVIHSKEAKAAILQVMSYAASRGVELAVVTNGHQLICFLATRGDGVPPLDGYCFAVDSLNGLDANFSMAWDLLSPEGISEKRYNRRLKLGGEQKIPPKLSSFLREHPKHRYLSSTQNSLRTLSELLLQDIGETESEEEQFYRRCYCSSGALSQHALLSKQMLEARYAAITEVSGLNSTIESANPKGANWTISPNIMQEAISRRPVILIGDVGVGKTSFLKHLIFEDAKDVFKNALYIYINFGARGTLDPQIKNLVLRDTEKQLFDRYKIDIRENSFLRGTYASEIHRFQNGVFSGLFHSDPPVAEQKLAEMLNGLLKDPYEHLRRAISHLTKGRHYQVVFILDNADQRSDNVQQEAFLIAQEMTKDWGCYVFVSLRPSTFYRSRTSGVLAAYPHRVFTISPPRIDEFLERRLTYALDMAEGRLPVERLTGIQLNIQSVALVIRALLSSLKSDDIQEFLTNTTGGNVRDLLQFITAFIGSPNVNAEKIVKIMKQKKNQYRIPLHEFSKAALLGDYSHYHAESSLAINVFDIRHADPREHFLLLQILAFMYSDGSHRDKDGFTSIDAIQTELQSHSFTIDQIDDAVKRATNKRLVETPNRTLFEEDPQLPLASMIEKYRITARGAYHLVKWMPSFAYMDAMAFDTPIFDEELRHRSTPDLESFDISVRHERAIAFRKYLLKSWQGSGIKSSYFDFEESIQRGEVSFASVLQATGRAI